VGKQPSKLTISASLIREHPLHPWLKSPSSTHFLPRVGKLLETPLRVPPVADTEGHDPAICLSLYRNGPSINGLSVPLSMI
jgi:hypothetical protein